METLHWDDIAYTVTAEYKSHSVDIEVFSHVGVMENGEHLFDLGDCNTTDDITEAIPAFTGFVKWDGCSNWDLSSPDGVMFHACDQETLRDVGELLSRCYGLGANLPSWEG